MRFPADAVKITEFEHGMLGAQQYVFKVDLQRGRAVDVTLPRYNLLFLEAALAIEGDDTTTGFPPRRKRGVPPDSLIDFIRRFGLMDGGFLSGAEGGLFEFYWYVAALMKSAGFFDANDYFAARMPNLIGEGAPNSPPEARLLLKDRMNDRSKFLTAHFFVEGTALNVGFETPASLDGYLLQQLLAFVRQPAGSIECRFCKYCDIPFMPTTKRAVFCSSSCRSMASRERRNDD
jgi:hypothetical protein